MLVALNTNNERCLSAETEKNNAPFHCPECGSEVILKKGTQKVHHYAHKPPTSCVHGKGEGELHYRVKLEIYQALKNHPNCEKCEIERRLEPNSKKGWSGLRPDISLKIRETHVAIEIQDSQIDEQEILKRMKSYEARNIYLVWVFPQNEPNKIERNWTEIQGKNKLICSPTSWQQLIHKLCFGRVYYWQHGAFVKPVHFNKYSYWIHSGNWVEDIGLEDTYWGQENVDDANYGGYNKTHKGKKIARTPKFKDSEEDILLHLADSFVKRDKLESEFHGASYPSAKVWIDNLPTWWK
jgi:competence protein CoiA